MNITRKIRDLAPGESMIRQEIDVPNSVALTIIESVSLNFNNPDLTISDLATEPIMIVMKIEAFAYVSARPGLHPPVIPSRPQPEPTEPKPSEPFPKPSDITDELANQQTKLPTYQAIVLDRSSPDSEGNRIVPSMKVVKARSEKNPIPEGTEQVYVVVSVSINHMEITEYPWKGQRPILVKSSNYTILKTNESSESEN